MDGERALEELRDRDIAREKVRVLLREAKLAHVALEAGRQLGIGGARLVPGAAARVLARRCLFLIRLLDLDNNLLGEAEIVLNLPAGPRVLELDGPVVDEPPLLDPVRIPDEEAQPFELVVCADGILRHARLDAAAPLRDQRGRIQVRFEVPGFFRIRFGEEPVVQANLAGE